MKKSVHSLISHIYQSHFFNFNFYFTVWLRRHFKNQRDIPFTGLLYRMSVINWQYFYISLFSVFSISFEIIWFLCLSFDITSLKYNCSILTKALISDQCEDKWTVISGVCAGRTAEELHVRLMSRSWINKYMNVVFKKLS